MRPGSTLARWARSPLLFLSLAMQGCNSLLSPSDARITVRVRSEPADPGIVVTVYVTSGGDSLLQVVPSGGTAVFDNLGSRHDFQGGTIGYQAYGCYDRRYNAPLPSVVWTWKTDVVPDLTHDVDLVCRSATLELNVTGLPAGVAGDVDFRSSGAPQGADTTHRVPGGPSVVAVFPSNRIVIIPRVVLSGGKVHQAQPQDVTVASRDTLAVNIAYVEQPSALTLVVAPQSLVVAPGASAQPAVTISRGSFPLGDVTLDLLNAPPGVSAQFSPNPVSGDASTATISVASFVPDGITPITVRASAGGLTQTATLTLDVQRPDFTMAASRPVLTVAPGDTGSVDLSFIRNATAVGAVALSHSTAPSGVTPSFDVASPTGNTARLTFTVAATAPPVDASRIIVTGSLGGVTRTVTVDLTIPGPTSHFGITMPSQVSVEQGLGLSVPIALTRSGSFVNAGIRLTASAPTMAGHEEVWIAPATAFDDAARLEVSTNVSSQLRTHRVTVTATQQGVVVGTATVDVTVGARAGADFAIVPLQKAITVAHGQIGRVDLTIHRYAGFTSSITLSAVGAPGNTLATFTPPIVGNTTATAELQFYVSPLAVPGTYALVIEGTAQNGTRRSTAVSLVIQPPAP